MLDCPSSSAVAAASAASPSTLTSTSITKARKSPSFNGISTMTIVAKDQGDVKEDDLAQPNSTRNSTRNREI